MQEESFRSRYIVKILSSVFIAAMNMVIQMILPRALSVEEFGYYSYNLNIFTSTVVLANLATSNAMVAKFARRNEEIGLVRFYFRYYFLEFLLLSVGIIILYPISAIRNSFGGQSLLMILLGLEYSVAIKLLSDVVSIFDAMAIAKISAFYQILLKLLIALFVIGTYFLGKLSLLIFYLGQVFGILFISIIMLHIIFQYQKKKYPLKKADTMLNYSREYYRYCKPLVFSAIVAQVIIIMMNWSLMHFSGVREQALFGAAWQLNAVISYVFAPYAELSKREYAVLADSKEGLGQFYVNSLKRMFWLTSYFACFLGFCSDWILVILYGLKYQGATTVTLFIMFYTVYQAWGQMNGSFMLATERTKLNAFISILGQLLTLSFVFLFQIPNPIWPKGLGSIGIALVYMVTNIISGFFTVYLISKDLGLDVWKNLKIQVVPLTLCSIVAWGLHYLLNSFLTGESMMIILGKFFLSGFFYTLLMAIFIFLFPEQVSLTKDFVFRILNRKKRL